MLNWLARKFAPETFRNAERYRHLITHIRIDRQWLGEFPEAQEAMTRLEMLDRDHWRALAEPHSGYRFGDISGFREELRRRTKDRE